MIPAQIRRRLERALETAKNFKGMSAGSPKVMLEICDVDYLLKYCQWLETGREPESVAFELTEADRGYTARARYLTEPRDQALVEIFKDGTLVRSFHYPAYKVWNIAAHFSDIVDSEIEQASPQCVVTSDGICRPDEQGHCNFCGQKL